MLDFAWVPKGGTSSCYHFHCPLLNSFPGVGSQARPPKRSQEPRGQMWLTESDLDSCLAAIQNGDIKNPDITSSLFHQKRRLSPCTSPQSIKSCQLSNPGGSRKNGERDLPNWGVGEVSGGHTGTGPLVTMTTLSLGIVWAPDKHKPL